jgi:23S rRNA G2445 N2-methylase RlmL
VPPPPKPGDFQYFASCAAGLAPILAQELTGPDVGAVNVVEG